MKLLQALLPALWLSACALDPYRRLEAETPTLSPAQVARLQKHSVPAPESPAALRAPETVTLPLLRVGHGPETHFVPVVLGTVNGKRGVRLLLDSGSNQNLFGYRLATALRIPVVENVGPVAALGIGGAVDNYPAVVPVMRIGSMEFTNLPALVGPDARTLSLTRGRQAMIVSFANFRQLSFLTIDARRGHVVIEPREPFVASDASRFVTHIPLRWENGLPVVEITMDGRGPQPCILDTGGNYGLLVPRKDAAEFGYWKPGRGRLGTSHGVGGATLDTGFVVRQLKLGDATLEKVPARTILIGPEPGGGKVLLGNVVLREYRVTFDFQRGRLWLER